MRLIVSTMKDEGPFILEWIAYYQFLGFDHFIINTNDCSDGTDKIIRRLEELGIASHIYNPGPWPRGPQASAYKRAMAHPRFKEAEWLLVCDADEFLDIRVGDHTLDSLFEVTPKTDVYPFVWRLFGHNGVVAFQDRFIIDQMTMAAPLHQTWPPQARAFKSLVRLNGAYKNISTHRPKGLRAKRASRIRWTDGDGQRTYGFENSGWGFNRTGNGFGTKLARMNHYAVRSIESYLMKRERGDVNTTSFHNKMEESGERYWKLHCWNVVEETSMQAKTDNVRAHFNDLRADPILDELHQAAVDYHMAKIAKITEMAQAQDFIKRYSDFRADNVVTIMDEAIVDPSLALNREHFDPTVFLRATKTARLKELKASHVFGKNPWFANLDALELAPQDLSAIEKEADVKLSDTFSNAMTPSSTARNARQNLISSDRKVFLDEVSGRRRKTWLLIGGTDRDLIEDLLERSEINKLYVIDPWGMKPNELFVDTVKTDPRRKALDLQYFQSIVQHQAEIKSGRLVILRSTPQWILRLFEDACLDVVFVNGARKPRQAKQILASIAKKLKPGGLAVFNSYRQRDEAGLQTLETIHELLGEEPQSWRAMGSDKTHIAIELLHQAKK